PAADPRAQGDHHHARAWRDRPCCVAPPRDDAHAIPSIAALRYVVLGIRMITNRYSAFTFSSILLATCLALTACTDDGTGDSGETETGETGETGEPGELGI